MKIPQLLICTKLVFISICAPCVAEEVIAGFDEQTDLPVLNERLREGLDKDNAIDSRVDSLEASYAQDTASTDTYVISLSKAPTSYTAGLQIFFKAVTANTGACTVNVNRLGAKSLKSLRDQDPADNYIETGSIVQAVYDGTNFQVLNPDANP